jgi:hypothetical protein
MWEVFYTDPARLASLLAFLAICIGFIANVAIKAWRSNEMHKRETELKMEMLARGMSADDITRVLAAKPSDATLAETTYQKKA